MPSGPPPAYEFILTLVLNDYLLNESVGCLKCSWAYYPEDEKIHKSKLYI